MATRAHLKSVLQPVNNVMRPSVEFGMVPADDLGIESLGIKTLSV
jgi:hypothetical protein